MQGNISDLQWDMLRCTYLLYAIFIPYMETHNWVNAKTLRVTCSLKQQSTRKGSKILLSQIIYTFK